MSSLHLGDLLDLEALEKAITDGYVRRQQHPDLPLTILNYTERCQYERAWTFVTTTCRGLIVNDEGHIVARPFAKFFNYSEHPEGAFDLGARVTVTDKLDGSLGILYPTPDGYAIATRGSFTSEQAQHATKIWRERYADTADVDQGITWLFEIIYPGNRIVCDYGDLDDLVLLGGVHHRNGVPITADVLDFPGPKVTEFGYATLAEALAAPPRPGAEGIVICFAHDATMVKVKQNDYVRLHRLVTGLNARAVWEALGAGNTIADICEPLPDEFHGWVENVAADLMNRAVAILTSARREHARIKSTLPDGWTRRDYAAAAATSPLRAWLFMLLDGKDPAPKIWRTLRPTGAERPFDHGEDAA
ncbi:RNA ligase [Spirillospora sp. NPDC127200]